MVFSNWHKSRDTGSVVCNDHNFPYAQAHCNDRGYSDMRPSIPLAALILLLTLLGGCAQYENKRGVDVNWQKSVTDTLEKGASTRTDVLDLLGPPSQVISLEDETAFYYLFERSGGDGLILVVYNRFRIDTGYDRAIFFFDEEDRLTDYATHIRE